jgi:muconate cycloisomerase
MATNVLSRDPGIGDPLAPSSLLADGSTRGIETPTLPRHSSRWASPDRRELDEALDDETRERTPDGLRSTRSPALPSESEATVSRIRTIEAIPVDVPRRPSRLITTAYGTIPSARFVVVVVTTDDGVEGIGEASPEHTWTGETGKSCFDCITDHLAPPLIGRDPLRIQEAVLRMDRAIAGNPSAKTGVEIALWDVAGKLANLSVANLWGGVVRERVAAKFVVSGEPDRASTMALEHLATGVRCIKIKAGFDPSSDIAVVRAVRNAVGPEVPIVVDANQGWSLQQALSVLPALETLGVLAVEQPAPRHPLEGLIEFRRRSRIPVIAHESVFTLDDACTLAARRAADFWALTPSTHGGYLKTREILAIARGAGVPCLLGSTYELGIGTAFHLHLAATSVGIDGTIPCDVRGRFYYESDLVREPIELQEGGIEPPTGAGLGVTLDRTALDRYRID